MSFYPSEKSKGLNGLNDVNIVTPVDNDAPVYNSTTQKWENVPIMTKEQWKKNGAYNLCPVTAVTQSLGGLTITVNSDGSVTVGSGTATSLIDLALNVKTDMILDDGNYRLVGCPNHPYVSLRVVTNNYNTNKVYDYGTGGNFSFSNSVDKNAAVYLRVNSGTVISSPITFKPMITTDLNATYADYVPYAKTNRELTEDTTASQVTFTTSTTGISNIYGNGTKIGNMCNVSFYYTGNTNTSTAVGTISVPPKVNTYVIGIAKLDNDDVVVGPFVIRSDGLVYQQVTNSTIAKASFSGTYIV